MESECCLSAMYLPCLNTAITHLSSSSPWLLLVGSPDSLATDREGEGGRSADVTISPLASGLLVSRPSSANRSWKSNSDCWVNTVERG